MYIAFGVGAIYERSILLLYTEFSGDGYELQIEPRA